MQQKFKHPTPYSFNNKYTLAFSPANDLDKLIKNNEIFSYDESHTLADFETNLQTEIPSIYYYVGYVYRRHNNNKIVDTYFRACNETLNLLDGVFYISQEYLFVDYDFGETGKKEDWTGKDLEKVKQDIANDPLLSQAIWYTTAHGLRFVFKLNAFKIANNTDLSKRSMGIRDYSKAYRYFVNQIKIQLPPGHFDLGTPANPFCLFRHPRSVKEDKSNLYSSFVHIPQDLKVLELFDYMSDTDKQVAVLDTQSKPFDVYFDGPEEEDFFYAEAVNALYHDPLFKEAREKNLTLGYPVWRALATNICAVTKNKPELGYKLFLEFSAWDTQKFAQTNENELAEAWTNVCSSVASGGPCTYAFILSNSSPLDKLTANLKVNLTGAPASEAWKKARKLYVAKYQKPLKLVNTKTALASTQAIQTASSSTSSQTAVAGNLASLENQLQGGSVGQLVPVQNGKNPKQKSLASTAISIAITQSNPLIPAASVGHTGLPADEVRDLLRFTMKGSGENAKPVLTKDLVNLEIIFENDINYKDRFSRNLLGFRNEYNRKEIQDELITKFRTDLVRDYGLQYSKDDVRDKVYELCAKNLYNPIYDYLSSLPGWDQVDRIGELLGVLSITSSNPNFDIYKTYIKKWLVSCVCRPMQWMKDDGDPSLNDKMDTLLVLKGGQGRGKSTFFKEICPNPSMFSDSLQRIETNEKDASIHLLNYWMIEFAEFDGLVKKSSVETLKHFLSRRTERFRPPYGRTEFSARRPSVLVGTTNSDQFLNDPTGSRRFWTIELEDTVAIDIEYIKQNRNQIWAQAVEMFENGEQWWLTEAEQNFSNNANDKFKRQDPWTEYVEKWINESDVKFNGRHGFTSLDVFKSLELKSGNVSAHDINRLKKILEELGYEERREYMTYPQDGKKVERRVRVWRLPDPKNISPSNNGGGSNGGGSNGGGSNGGGFNTPSPKPAPTMPNTASVASTSDTASATSTSDTVSATSTGNTVINTSTADTASATSTGNTVINTSTADTTSTTSIPKDDLALKKQKLVAALNQKNKDKVISVSF